MFTIRSRATICHRNMSTIYVRITIIVRIVYTPAGAYFDDFFGKRLGISSKVNPNTTDIKNKDKKFSTRFFLSLLYSLICFSKLITNTS